MGSSVTTASTVPGDDRTGKEAPRKKTWIPDPASEDYVKEWNALLLRILDEEEDGEDYSISLLRENCPRDALRPMGGRRTPLHVAVDRRDPRPDMIRWLSDTAPELVNVREDALLPIEILSNHILTKEEMQKYRSNGRTSDANWECVGILAPYYSTRYRGQPTPPTLHACLAAPDCCPASLLERALRRYQDQALVPDAQGNLPLHIVLSPSAADEDYFDVHFVREVLRVAPEATQRVNGDGCLPLDIAILASGRRHELSEGQDRWRQALLLADLARWHKPGLDLRGRLPQKYYYYLFSEILQRSSPEATFRLLQTSSNLV